MRSNLTRASVFGLALASGFFLLTGRTGSALAAPPSTVPAPLVDNELARVPGQETAVFAGGCFWGVQAVFQHVKGVKSSVSGYTGGRTASPNYQDVSSGSSGHAEVVRVIFDPSKVSYGTLLRVFFAVAHDPTQLNRQGPDVGTQYRSEIFFTTESQRRISAAYIDQLNKAKVFRKPIVTKLSKLGALTIAEDYHQNYANEHPNEPYIRIHDAPKVEALRKDFPQLWKKELSAWR